MRSSFLGAIAVLVTLAGCGESESRMEGRWYTQPQVDRGKELFTANCAGCHGAAAQGSNDWSKPLANGKYPPPPLNGSAHAWHHPLKGLKKTIGIGGVPLGGTMPGFGQQLSEDDTEALISYFQSFWPEPVYQAWLDRGGLK